MAPLQCTTNPTLKVLTGVYDTQALAAAGAHQHAMAHVVTGATDLVPYDLYTDAGTSALVLNNIPFFTSINDGSIENVILYGKAFREGLNLIPGTYTDTLTIEFEF